jgi:hypothetical protein
LIKSLYEGEIDYANHRGAQTGNIPAKKHVTIEKGDIDSPLQVNTTGHLPGLKAVKGELQWLKNIPLRYTNLLPPKSSVKEWNSI